MLDFISFLAETRSKLKPTRNIAPGPRINDRSASGGFMEIYCDAYMYFILYTSFPSIHSNHDYNIH